MQGDEHQSVRIMYGASISDNARVNFHWNDKRDHGKSISIFSQFSNGLSIIVQMSVSNEQIRCVSIGSIPVVHCCYKLDFVVCISPSRQCVPTH